MLHDLDQQMEKRPDDGCTLWIKLYSKYKYEIRYHPGKTNVVIDVLRRKEQVKPRCVRARAMTIQYEVRGMILSSQKFRWMIYLLVLADTTESVSDAIGFEYCLASSSGWTNYHSSIWCAPFEALYGMKCRSHVLWAEIGESSLTGPELVLDMTDKLEFEVGDRVMLKVSPWKGVIRFGKKGKLAPRYVGPFKILERVSPVAYRLRLPEELSGVDKTLHFVEEPVENSDREVKRLKCNRMVVVKVHLGLKQVIEIKLQWERTNRPLYVVESDYESWKIRIERYIRVTEGEGDAATQVTRDKRDEEFTEIEKHKELVNSSNQTHSQSRDPRHVFNRLKTESYYRKENWALCRASNRRAPGNVGNVGNTGNRGTQNYRHMTDNIRKKVICYNYRGEGHVSGCDKEKKRVKDSHEALLDDVEYEGLMQQYDFIYPVPTCHAEVQDVQLRNMSQEQVYWLPAEELATQKSNPPKPVTLFVRTRPAKSQISTCLQGLNSLIPAFAHVILQQTDQGAIHAGSREIKTG
ncbi:hypothetical protein Tco_0870108 [Tanacetum coccineum]